MQQKTAEQRDVDTAGSRPAAARKGKAGSYRRKVAPGALALKEAAQARYIADMRAHFDEVTGSTSTTCNRECHVHSFVPPW